MFLIFTFFPPSLKNQPLFFKNRTFRKPLCNQFSLEKDLAGIVLFFRVRVFGGEGVLAEVVCGMASLPNHQGRAVKFWSQFSNDIMEHSVFLKKFKNWLR